jgi:aconitate hydratase
VKYIIPDETYYERAMAHREPGSFIVGGNNYGQGSSREHAAIAPRYLGVRAVVAKSFARIHRQNLINFGILPLTLVNPDDWEKIDVDDLLKIPDLRVTLQNSGGVEVINVTRDETYLTEHFMSDRQVEMVRAGGLINVTRSRRGHAGISERVQEQ